MSKQIRLALIQITKYGWMALLLGIGLFALATYSQYKASDEHAFTARDKLQTLTGKVESATEVTVTSTGRRGSSRVSNRYYEISVKPATGTNQSLRLSLSVNKDKVEAIIDEQVIALFDADDQKIVYDLRMGDKVLLDFETTRAKMQAQAASKAKSTGSMTNIGLSLLLVLFGAGGMFFNRKLKKQHAVEEALVTSAA